MLYNLKVTIIELAMMVTLPLFRCPHSELKIFKKRKAEKDKITSHNQQKLRKSDYYYNLKFPTASATSTTTTYYKTKKFPPPPIIKQKISHFHSHQNPNPLPFTPTRARRASQTVRTLAEAAPKKMVKAIRVHELGGPEVLKWEDVELGEPKEGEIRVKNKAIGLNFIDVYFRKGVYKTPTLPYTPGLLSFLFFLFALLLLLLPF